MASSSSSVSGLTSSSGTSSLCDGAGSSSGASATEGSSGSTPSGSKLGSAQRSKALTSFARITSLGFSLAIYTDLDHFFAALGTQDDFPGVGHAASNGKDFLLRRLDIADAHGSLGLQVVAQQFARALGHVLEDFFLDRFVGTFERHDQHLGRYLAQQYLNASVIDIGQVVEDEHQVFDLCRQVF